MKTFILALALTVMNPTYSPDSSKIAYTKGNDLYVKDVATQVETRLTEDGSRTVLNGYASWVYYEEIFGRSCNYRAFSWSPDSRKLAFYRFDNSGVPEFPIFSPFGQGGSLNLTRYPKAGQQNPEVKIGIVNLEGDEPRTVWADFDSGADQYFGPSFWNSQSSELYVQWEPRRQNLLRLFRVSAGDGSKALVYEDSYPTWLNWIEGMLFGKDGLYMARDDDESGWAQIFYLSYDGKTLKKLTEGKNWDVSLIKVNEKKGDLWFVAKRDNPLHPALYRLDRKGRITALTSPEHYLKSASVSDDFKTAEAELSNAREVPFRVRFDALKGWKSKAVVYPSNTFYDPETMPVSNPVMIRHDGFDLWGLVSYPKGFDSNRRHPVVMQLYGGPGTPYVRDRWNDRDAVDKWCFDNGIIYIVVDPRSSGENGRRGMDQAFRRMTVVEQEDYLAWVEWLKSQPYVDGSRIGVEGFSFGGTTTAKLVLSHPEAFRCGIAGGGVYDWTLYDSNYTERFMETPADNPDGYAEASVIHLVKEGKVSPDYRPGSLKLTHGTGDDNVHFQNTLLLVDALQQAGIQFELMAYPDGMHGYRNGQKRHSDEADHIFWSKWLL